MALQEPVPGQPLTATWGRDVVRELRSLRPLGGPGMRVTRGPNGVTIASTRKGGGDASERVGQYPFRLAFRDVLESGVTKKYAVVYANDGAVQKDGESDVDVAECANDEATGMEQGWFDIAEYFDDESGEQVTNDLATVIASSGGVKDVYALVYYDADGVFSVAIQMTPDWPAHSSFAEQIDRYYLGSIQRTDSGSGSSAITTFSITNQALRSGVVATGEEEESDESLPRPWQMKFGVGASGTTGTDATPLLVYCPYVCLNGIAATVDNSEFGATGSGWYKVPYTRNASSWTNVSAFLDTEQDPPHLVVTAGNGPSGEPATAPTGYLPESYMAVGKIATDVGPSGEELTPEVKTQYLVGDAYRALDEFRPYKPFEIRSVWDETENASIPLVYLPLVYIDGELATVDNTVYGSTGSEWYEIDCEQITGDTAYVTAYIKRASDGNHVNVSTATTAPTGFTDGQIDVGDLVLVNSAWKATEQYQVGAAHKDYIKPMTLRIVGSELQIYWPTGTLTAYAHPSQSLYLDATINPLVSGNWYHVHTGSPSWATGVGEFVTLVLNGTFSVQVTNNAVGPRLGYIKKYESGVVISQYVTGPQFYTPASGGGGGATISITGSASEATSNIVTFKETTGATGLVTMEYHSKVLGSAVNPAGETGEKITYNGTEYNTLSGLIGQMIPTTEDRDFVLNGDDIDSEVDFTKGTDKVLTTASITAGGVGPSGSLMVYDSDGMINTADRVSISNLFVESTEAEEGRYALESEFNSDGLFKYGAIGVDDTEIQTGITGIRAIGFDGSSATPAYNASLLEVATLAPTGSDPSVAYWPKADAPTGEIGTSEYAARADHIHPIETGVGTLVEKDTSTTSAGDDYSSITGFEFDETTWTPGENGIEISMCVRTFSRTQGAVKYRYFIYRKFKWSKNGLLISVGAEYVGYQARYA